MNRLALIALLVACGSKSQKVEPVRTIAGDLVIADVTIVPMDRDTTVPHQTVIVRGDKIVAIAPAATIEIAPGSTKIDGAGKWLMPGLADMHVHTWTENDLAMFVGAGVTTIRNMWGSDLILGWQKTIAAGTQFGPTIVTTSPILDGDPPVWPGSVVVAKPEDAEGIVAGLEGQGYDALKVYSRLDKPVYEALAVAAKKHGMTLQGHVPTAVGLEGALAAGQRSIEHLDGWLLALTPGETREKGESLPQMLRRLLPKVDESRIPAVAEQMKKAGTYNCATLIVLARMALLDDVPAVEKQVKWLPMISAQTRARWNPKADFRLAKSTPEDFATMRASNALRGKIARVIATSGAPMLVGTDTGNPYVVPGESMHDEIELLVAAGAPRPRVLRAATADAGTFLGHAGTVGVVTVGARADLLLVTVDPLTTPLPLVPEGVVLRGTWLDKHELETKLAAITNPPPVADRFKGMPPLAPEGENVIQVHYDLESGTNVIGEERLAIGLVAGKRVIVAQVVNDTPSHIETTYRIAGHATRVETSFGRITLDAKPVGGKLVATGKDAAGKPLELSEPLPADAFIAGPGIGGSIEIVAKLATMKVGDARTVTSLELSTFPKPSIERATVDVKRKPDVDGNRVYDLVMKFSGMPISSELVIDAKGIPVKQTFGAPLDMVIVRR